MMTERVQSKSTIHTTSPEETQRFGIELAKSLEPQTVIGLIGALGAGKTCLTQGICAGLKVEEYVTSPSFTLINEYQGRLPVYHFDLFRIDDPKEMLDLGCEEYFYGDGVCIIEWAEKMAPFLPEQRIEIALKRIGENEREITTTHVFVKR
jgi:tRNA threonylcarbamoyladenosine biosynthesis protein TsaE